MKPWFEEHPVQWRAECEAAMDCFVEGTVRYPQIGDDGTAKIIGQVRITDDEGRRLLSIRLRLEYPPRFPPKGMLPNVFDHDGVFPAPDADGHIFEGGRFCLGAPGEERYDAVARTYRLRKLIPYVRVFLLQEFIYGRDRQKSQLSGRRPQWPGKALAHGREGIRQAGTGPNDRCPCGSGQKYKRCCMRRN